MVEPNEEPGEGETSGIDLLPNSEDETEEGEENAAKSSEGLSAARKRQLERALRKKSSRAGRHFYEEVNVKNKNRANRRLGVKK